MKKSLVILLLFSILGSSFSRYTLYITFKLNRKNITLTLCENKNRPWLNCNGFCYYKKLIKAVGDRDGKLSKKPANSESEYYFQDLYNILAYSRKFNPDSEKILDKFSFQYGFRWTDSIFHPPKPFFTYLIS